jgi:hypothetical protein
MTKKKLGMIQSFGQEVEAAAGSKARRTVLKGFDELTARTSGKDIALWVRDSIDRLDASVPEATRLQIMDACGINCTRVNHSAIARGQSRRAKFDNEEVFLAAEIRKPQAGTRLERNGNVLIQTYTPQSYTHPMRCYCGLLRELPQDVEVSPTYCNCSKAFVRTYWSAVLGRPVKVKILESALTGSTECKFKISI